MLKTNLESLKQSIKWLRRSYDICAGSGLKDLRNEIAHEYETEDIRSLFSLVFASSAQLFEIAATTAKYCEKYPI
jgi:hypothetical protein